jgi:hypothetical protein
MVSVSHSLVDVATPNLIADLLFYLILPANSFPNTLLIKLKNINIEITRSKSNYVSSQCKLVCHYRLECSSLSKLAVY